MALSKQDWYKLGETAALEGSTAAMRVPKGGSWQYAAFNAGRCQGRFMLSVVPDRDAIARAAERMQAPVRQLTATLDNLTRATRTAAQALVVAQLRMQQTELTHWPEGAREHFGKLIDDFAREHQLKRRERLFRALSRMLKKRGARAA